MSNSDRRRNTAAVAFTGADYGITDVEMDVRSFDVDATAVEGEPWEASSSLAKVYSPGAPMVQPQALILAVHFGGWAWSVPVTSSVKTVATIAVSTRRVGVIFIFSSSL